jgi:hypothetical protein
VSATLGIVRPSWSRCSRGVLVSVWTAIVALILAGAAPLPAQSTAARPAAPRAQPGDTAFRVLSGVKVSADTVTVGDPFLIVVRVRAPLGAEIVFPEAPDSAGAVQARDPRTIATAPDTSALEQTATYRVAAWDVEQQRILLDDVVVRWEGEERRVPVGDLAVFVKSVLPADSTQRVPKPARALVEHELFPWWLIAAILAALAVIGLLVWWWYRRRHAAAVVVPVDAYEHARREFTRIEGLALADAGERGRHVALMVEVLRDYLAVRVANARLSHTSGELVTALRGERLVPRDRLARLLAETDLIKFARSSVTREHALELGQEARAIVDEAQSRWAAARAAEADAQARAARAGKTDRAA